MGSTSRETGFLHQRCCQVQATAARNEEHEMRSRIRNVDSNLNLHHLQEVRVLEGDEKNVFYPVAHRILGSTYKGSQETKL